MLKYIINKIFEMNIIKLTKEWTSDCYFNLELVKFEKSKSVRALLTFTFLFLNCIPHYLNGSNIVLEESCKKESDLSDFIN